MLTMCPCHEMKRGHMAVSTRVVRAIEQTLGDDAGDEAVNWMREMEANDISIAERMDRSFQVFQAQIDARFEKAEARLDARFAEFHRIISAEINSRFNDLLKWSFVFWAGAVGAIA